MVFEEGKHLFLLLIYQTSPCLILEEFSLPISEKANIVSWQKWVEQKIPSPTSHLIYEIDLERSLITDCYSFTKGSFMQGGKDHLLFQLFSLSFSPLAKEHRRKIGPPPIEDEPDRRSIWNPPYIYEGKERKNPSYQVYFATWPEDDSPYSSAEIETYFAELPFPSWLEVRNSHLRLFAKAIDSGKNLRSPTPFFPRRTPQILYEKKDQISLYVPDYMYPFILAKDSVGKEKVESNITRIQKEKYIIRLDFEGPVYLIPQNYPFLSHSISRTLYSDKR